MVRIGLLTCSNYTQGNNCGTLVCLGAMRKRRGFFERYQNDNKLNLIGIINCSRCPNLAAPEKILKRIKAFAQFRLDALHFSYCMTALCSFLKIYQAVIAKADPDFEIVSGTHIPRDKKQFKSDVIRELLCPTVTEHQKMNNIIRGTFKSAKIFKTRLTNVP